MSQMYFISDLHLNHNNIIKYCNRPFKDVEEMNKTIIDNWNKRVKDEDLVYILGDLTLGGPTAAKEFLKQLKGHKIITFGNHDWKWKKDPECLKYFITADKDARLVLHGLNEAQPYEPTTIYLSHYPVKIEDTDADYVVYGHIHNNEDDPFWEYQKHELCVLNACADVNDFKPVTFLELIANNMKIKEVKTTI